MLKSVSEVRLFKAIHVHNTTPNWISHTVSICMEGATSCSVAQKEDSDQHKITFSSWMPRTVWPMSVELNQPEKFYH